MKREDLELAIKRKERMVENFRKHWERSHKYNEDDNYNSFCRVEKELKELKTQLEEMS